MFDDLSFGICWFNDEGVFRLLDSLPAEAKKYVVDGKFAKNKNPQLLSDESLREKVREYPNVILIDAPDMEEPEKRNQYLINNPHKYLIVIDSDEYISALDDNRFLEAINKLDSGIHHIFFETDKEGGTSTYPRLWVNPKDWRYVLCHNIFRNNVTGEILKSGFSHGETLPGMLCGMDDDLRSEEQLKDTYDYQVEMMKFEKVYREKYRDGDMTPFA